MDPLPTQIARTDNGIRIEWNTGAARIYTAASLRKLCPCAVCREKHGHKAPGKPAGPIALPVLSLAEAAPVQIQHMQPVGNYGYHIQFSDGHDSGIFTFEFLSSAGDPA